MGAAMPPHGLGLASRPNASPSTRTQPSSPACPASQSWPAPGSSPRSATTASASATPEASRPTPAAPRWRGPAARPPRSCTGGTATSSSFRALRIRWVSSLQYAQGGAVEQVRGDQPVLPPGQILGRWRHEPHTGDRHAVHHRPHAQTV